ncbi:solute carrier family 22 member 7-like [Aplysia californica]|uniref:Solute carrier family 22 member 7-like n=1 Tax=Aplysia californica TaxID=6500 RepID=A0ABM0JIZ3_APLCA|nr:solute carrier family 22 member 7-like [Aplysia californica]
MANFEDLIEELGGLGKFQVFLTFCIISCQFFIGWSMLQMSYSGLIPDYRCLIGDDVDNTTQRYLNNNLNVCEVNGTSCTSYHFYGSSKTVISEWDIVCDLKWAKPTITSVQMGGVLLGAILAGQMSDTLGRKNSLYSFVTFHIVLNVVAAFSVSWIMFAVLRFFIGVGIGAVVVIVFNYPIEFLPIKWRPVLSIIPSWTLGVALFSAAALVLDNWSHLHLACAILSTPSLLGFFFVPESIRWLAVQGRLKEANAVVEKIARFNGTEIPVNTAKILQEVVDTERKSRETAQNYIYLDLFRSLNMAKNNVVLWFFWFSLSSSFYGISFGVASLSGNLYLNIFLLAIMELPVQFSTFFLNNKFGRKRSSLAFFTLAALPCLGCLLAQLLASDDVRGPAVNGLSLTAKMMVGAAWSCAQIWTSELYPTVVRNLGFGFGNVGARVGGIVAPFIINLDDMPVVAYAVMTGLLFSCSVLTLVLAETKGSTLSDSLATDTEGGKKQNHHEKGEMDMGNRVGGGGGEGEKTKLEN